MEGDLQKQRRNLLVVSVLLIIQAVAEVDISKVSLLGTELKTEKVGVLLTCFWILWGYFLLRYYQYWFVSDEAKKLRTSLSGRRRTYLEQYGQTRANAWFGEDKQGSWALDFVEGSPTLLMSRTKNGSRDIERELIPRSVLLRHGVRALIWVSVQTTAATEHVLPFALAAVAPVTWALTHWPEVAAAVGYLVPTWLAC